MPTYEFRCLVCNHIQEKKLPITSKVKEIPCEISGCLARRQVSGGGGFFWKSEGFYIKDYSNNKKKGK
jgi:putative FmdB family regulatory protein